MISDRFFFLRPKKKKRAAEKFLVADYSGKREQPPRSATSVFLASHSPLGLRDRKQSVPKIWRYKDGGLKFLKENECRLDKNVRDVNVIYFQRI